MPKPPVKSVLVRFRSYPKELAAWRRLARAEAMNLSTWIRDSLNARLDEPNPIESTRGRRGARLDPAIAIKAFGSDDT